MIPGRRKVIGVSSRGHSFTYWEPVMPYIPPYVLYNSIYLYPSVEAAEEGRRAGGSGCLVAIPFPETGFDTTKQGLSDGPLRGHAYAVTNSHVVSETLGDSPVIRMNLTAERFDIFPLDARAWIHHPDGDDLAVAPISFPNVPHAAVAVMPGSFVRRDRPRWYQPGTDTFMVGRFINHEGRQRNLPTVRFGNVSAIPHEPVLTERGIAQECFLVEERSFSGYSGSPVFVFHEFHETLAEQFRAEGLPADGDAPQRPMLVTKFLGINAGHLRHWSPISERGKRSDPDEKFGVYHNTGMAVVVPAWKLIELLESEELTHMREETERELREQSEGVALDSAGETEFDRFKELARKLANTPKPKDEGES